MHNEVVNVVIGFGVLFVEACGALVVLLGVIRTVVQYILVFLGQRSSNSVTRLRMRLGQSMVMGLEFQVAADILKTALSPTWNEILLLAALIGLRTVLNYLLEHELRTLYADTAPSTEGRLQKEPVGANPNNDRR
jgi:uncharacterized membrane protein